ncbi:MAG: ABC transporter permease subunit [Firmicutes bacterium]|nr:ABC transporter permease subunit [Bacillota bacterium]
MPGEVFARTLKDQKRNLAWWAVGTVFFAVLVVLVYPSYSAVPELERLLEEAPPALKAFFGESASITSPVGFLNTELFFFMVPLVFIILAVGRGSDAVAGEEERGTLELLLSLPLSRRRLVLEKAAAMVITMGVLSLAMWLGIAAGSLLVEIDLTGVYKAAATISGALLGLTFGALALAIGAWRGGRGISIGISGVVGVATYLLNVFGTTVNVLEPFRPLSPFYYYIGAEPLAKGLNLGHAGVLTGLSVILIALAVTSFDRRDVAK